MDKTNITLNKFTCDTSLTTLVLFKELLKHEYSTNVGWGFSSVNLLDNMIYAKLLKDVTAYYRVWNSDTHNMERISYKMIKEVSFYIDFANCFICVEGGNSCMNSLKQTLRTLFWNKFVYSPLSITPYDYIVVLQDKKILERVDEITIDDYKSCSSFLGKYTAKIVDSDLDISILSPLKTMISKAKMMLTIDDDIATLAVSRSCTISMACSDNIKSKVFEQITKIVY